MKLKRLELKDIIYFVVMYTFHEKVDFAYIKSGDHVNRYATRNLPDEELLSVLNEMLSDDQLLIDNEEYLPTKRGREIFNKGGYLTLYHNM